MAFYRGRLLTQISTPISCTSFGRRPSTAACSPLTWARRFGSTPCAFPRPGPGPLSTATLIRGSDGPRATRAAKSSGRASSPRSREDNSTDRFEHILDTYAPSPKIRFLEISIISADPRRRGGYNTGPNIAEYQLFSTGYPAQVVLTSDLIALPGARNFGAITWEAETPPGTTRRNPHSHRRPARQGHSLLRQNGQRNRL